MPAGAIQQPLIQSEIPLKVIEDLGTKGATATSKWKSRYAIFECACGVQFEATVKDVKRGSTQGCQACRKIRLATTLINLTTGKKTCQKCKIEKDLEDYSNNKNSKDGKGSRCRICDGAARKKYYATNQKGRESAYIKSRERMLKKVYGIAITDYTVLLETQNNSCGICTKTLEDFQTKDGSKSGKDKRPRMFAVDHDHKTGAIRGLLCNECNRGLGMLGDTKEAIQKALTYLENTENSNDTSND